MTEMTTWKIQLIDALKDNKETLNDIISNTMSEEEMNVKFDAGFGGEEGIPFTVWTKDYVYFPVCYDGSEWIGYVPRNPNGCATSHWGGG